MNALAQVVGKAGGKSLPLSFLLNAAEWRGRIGANCLNVALVTAHSPLGKRRDIIMTIGQQA